MRELRSNDSLLEEIARRTRGRVLDAWDVKAADLFSRQNVPHSSSPLPVWDVLLKILLGLVLLDVACRRLAWDWNATRQRAAAVGAWIRSFTTTRQVKAEPTLEALRRVRDEVAETKLRQLEAPPSRPPNSGTKFEAGAAPTVDITGSAQATAEAGKKPPAPKAPAGKPPESADVMGGLLEAKRRAREHIRRKEEEE